MVGSATFTTVASRTIMRKPVQSTIRATQRFFSFCSAVMANRTGWGTGINRSRYSGELSGLVTGVVQGQQRQVRQPQHRTPRKAPAAPAETLELDHSQSDDHEGVLPL